MGVDSATPSADVAKLQALQAEYFRLEEIIEDFDNRALTIKAWSVTLCTAGVGAAYIQSEPALLLISSMAAMLFWIIEALWKSSQQAFYERTMDIERASQNDRLLELKPFNIASSWSNSWHQSWTGGIIWRRIMWWPHVALPHVAVAAGGALLFVGQLVWWELE